MWARYADWVGGLVGEGLHPETVRTYRSMGRRFLEALELVGGDPWGPDAMHVRMFAASLPPSQAAKARTVVSRWCAFVGAADSSGAVRIPRTTQRRARRGALDRDEAVALVATAGRSGRKGLAVLVGLYTAARRGEIASLAWQRVDLEAGTLTLERSKTRDLHTVPLHPSLGKALTARKLDVMSYGWTPWVFPGRRAGAHVRGETVWRWTVEVSRIAGVEEMTTHRMRHTALTLLNERTRDLRAAQTLAGHSSPATTALYTTATDRALADAVGELEYG